MTARARNTAGRDAVAAASQGEQRGGLGIAGRAVWLPGVDGGRAVDVLGSVVLLGLPMTQRHQIRPACPREPRIDDRESSGRRVDDRESSNDWAEAAETWI